MKFYHNLLHWQLPHTSSTPMDTQPPPDELVKEAQELAQAYRRVIARRNYSQLLTMRLMELIADYGLLEVQRELARIEQNMALAVSSAGDPRR